MIERARESDEVLAKQIEYLASVLSSIEHCREEEEDDEKKEKFETNEEVEVEVEGIGKYYDDENDNRAMTGRTIILLIGGARNKRAGAKLEYWREEKEEK